MVFFPERRAVGMEKGGEGQVVGSGYYYVSAKIPTSG